MIIKVLLIDLEMDHGITIIFFVQNYELIVAEIDYNLYLYLYLY